MPSEKPARRLRDIIENIDRIRDYTDGYDRERFDSDRKCRDAVERCLLRISEAATKLTGVAETLAPDQPWSEIRGLGNLPRHEYDRVERKTIWDIIINDAAPLRRAAVTALDTLKANESKEQ